MADNPSNFEVAVSAYREECDLNNLPFKQPIEAYSQQINSVVYLRTNATSFVARYDVQRGRILV